jgi:hypothetical protein
LADGISTSQATFCSLEIWLENCRLFIKGDVMSGLEEIAKLVGTPEPPELGPGPRAGVQPEASLNRPLDEVFRREKLPAQKQQLIRALILLWHDHLEAAHVIAQDIENADGAFVHGIMHRREPDFSNAKYWFHRVGKHPAFAEIASRVGTLLDAKGERDLRAKLIPDEKWDAFAFVDACEQGSRQAASGEHKRMLREIQGAESLVLLEWFSRQAPEK